MQGSALLRQPQPKIAVAISPWGRPWIVEARSALKAFLKPQGSVERMQLGGKIWVEKNWPGKMAFTCASIIGLFVFFLWDVLEDL